MKKLATEMFILSKPWNVGRFNRTFRAGTVIEIDREKDVLSTDGHEYQGLAEFLIATAIKDKKSGLALILPYSEKSPVIKQILSSVKDRIQEQEFSVKKYKVINSDADITDEIDVSFIKTKPKEKISGKDKVSKMKVVPETGITIPFGGKDSLDQLAKKINALQTPAKMKIVKEDEGSDTGATVKTSANVKVRAMASNGLRKK